MITFVSSSVQRMFSTNDEGHIIDYSISYTGQSIQLISGEIPGAPFFRLTYTFLDQNSTLTKFEMSRDGQTFMTYLEGISIRVL